jgi:predicted porin
MRVQIRATALAAGAFLILAATSSAQAQSSVSLYGLMDLSVGSFQNPGADASKGVVSGNMTTSFFGLKGTEDLGGGLSAQFSIESFLRSDTGAAGRFDADPFWARSAWVGLSGGFGSVNVGRNTTSLFVNTLIFNAFGDSFGFSPSIRHTFTSGTVSGDTGWSDSIKYSSPRFGGLSFTAHVAANDEGGASGRNKGVSALYFGGPVGLGFAWQKAEKGATVPDTTSWQLGGSYAFSGAKAFAQYGSVDNDSTGNSYDITGLGVSVGIGAGSLLGQWGRISPETGSARTTFTVGYDYNLSKRTDLYAVYMSDKISGLDTGNTYAVGIRHRF